MKTPSIHIVRHYGFVGGMENYVVELTQALSKKGQSVTVICERSTSTQNDLPIDVIELGCTLKKPRWLAQWLFSKKVTNYLKANKAPDETIHSHERSSDHQVTTFHGPPFLNRKRRLLDCFSPRIHMWTWLEKKELLGDQVKLILPNSPLIADQLIQHYPSVASKIGKPAYPGVAPSYSQLAKTNHPLTIGFIGREWKRKGLTVACEIVKQLQLELPELHFLVAGCDPKEINHLFTDFPENSYTLVGWSENTEGVLQEIDLLLHPATAEPFGMVIAEANATGIPVVVSEQCGIADLITNKQGSVCRLGDDFEIKLWVTACKALLTKPTIIESLNLSWDELATQHIDLYSSLQA